jgi:hypothetical protein
MDDVIFFIRKLIIITVYKEIQVISFRINDIYKYIVQTKLLCSPNLVHLISSTCLYLIGSGIAWKIFNGLSGYGEINPFWLSICSTPGSS